MESSLLNVTQLETFLDLGREMFEEILGEAIQTMPTQLEAIKQAIKTARGPNHELHRLKGTLLSFGCQTMTQRVQELEHQPIPETEADTIHTELNMLWEKSLEALRDWASQTPELTD